MKHRFCKWTRWADREGIERHCPGIYAFAVSRTHLAGKPFSFTKKIIYFGMTNARYGLNGRLRQFENTLRGKTGHGGAMRVRYKYPEYRPLVARLFVSVWYFECNVNEPSAKDWRVMGRVAYAEYACIGEYMRRYGRIPEFNDKKRSPKAALDPG